MPGDSGARRTALGLAVFFAASSLYIAGHRLLWFDEILTSLICRLPSLTTMWRALAEVAEQTPALYFAVARTGNELFGPSDLGLRAASALAFGITLLVTFDTARRLTDARYGLIAMSFVATPFAAYYGHEARSYAVFLLLAAVAVWLWNFARGTAGAAAFGLTFLAGTAIHYYFVLCLAPFAMAAARERRWFHPKMWAAAGAVAAALAVLYPQIASARRFAQTLGSVWRPTVASLLETYMELLPLALILFGVWAVAMRILRRHGPTATLRMGPEERTAWLFLALPFLAWTLGLAATHIFHDRYAIGAAPGFAVAAACFLWRRYGKARQVSLGLLICAVGIAVAGQCRTLAHSGEIRAESGDYQARTRRVLALEDTLLGEGKRHVVFNWDVQYLETWQYTKHRDAYECVTAEKRWAIGRYVPLRFVSVGDVVARRRESALVSPSPELLDTLKRAGVRVVPRFAGPEPVFYLE